MAPGVECTVGVSRRSDSVSSMAKASSLSRYIIKLPLLEEFSIVQDLEDH